MAETNETIETIEDYYNLLFTKYNFTYAGLYWPIYNFWYIKNECIDGQIIPVDKFINTRPNERKTLDLENLILIYERTQDIDSGLELIIKYAGEKVIFRETLILFSQDAKHQIYRSANELLIGTLNMNKSESSIRSSSPRHAEQKNNTNIIETSALLLSTSITNLFDLILNIRRVEKNKIFKIRHLVKNVVKIVQNKINYYIEEPLPEYINNNYSIIEEILIQLLSLAPQNETFLYIKSTPLDVKIEKFKYKISFFMRYENVEDYLKKLSLYHSNILSKKINSEIYIDDDKNIIFNLFTF